MAALSSIRPFSGFFFRWQSIILPQNMSIAALHNATTVHQDRCDSIHTLFRSNKTIANQCAPPFPASQRRLQTSSHQVARFQRPHPVTPDEVDWSKMDSLNSPYKHTFDPDLVEQLLDKVHNHMPVSDMPDPFEKNYRRCSLCRHDVYLDHKNVRLLSQFVSPYTGRIYGRAITGLCIPMQKRVAALIKRARMSGCMPYMFKDPKYLHDPQPYDVMAGKS